MNKALLLVSTILLFCSTTNWAQERRILTKKQYSGTVLNTKQEAFLNSHKEGLKAFEMPASCGVIEIPIKVHIVRGQTETVSIDQVQAAFDQLNQFFINIYVQFVVLGDYNYINQPDLYDFDKSQEANLCSKNDVDKVINLYLVGSISDGPLKFCGYTYYPEDLERNTDRIVLNQSCLDDGVSLARQIGHYFTLFPTAGPKVSETMEFVDGTNCAEQGDLICDTPADPELTYESVDERCGYIGRKQDQSGRKRFYKPDTRNIMSENPRTYCINHFTEGQYRRMRYAVVNLRNYLTFPKRRYTKRQLKTLTEEKGLKGEVVVYMAGQTLNTIRKENVFVDQGGPYAQGTAYNIAVVNDKKGYVYVLEGDGERGIYLQFPQKGERAFFKGEESAAFTVPKAQNRLKVDELKGENGVNHIVVLFSKKQLRIEDLIDEMNNIEEPLDALQRMFAVLGTDLIPTTYLDYDKTGSRVQGIATDQQIMPLIIEYKQQ
ncbi:MAG: hypothetical protein AB8E82_07525 [Aureispira sp.]